MDSLSSILEILGNRLKQIISSMPEAKTVTEIRIRANKPLCATFNGREFFITPCGTPVDKPEKAYIVGQKDIYEALALISGYSIYAFEEEIKKGFITVKGGHRIGICGKAVIENNEIKTVKNISSLNIRVAREITGAADGVMDSIINKGAIKNTIIISPPAMGKTTLLRDIVRQLSNGVASLDFAGVSVALLDERSEIAGTYMGAAQNDVGRKTDVLDGCPKAIGMQMMLRSMSPVCVAADEIGGKEDINAINEMSTAGIKIICTVHGENISDIFRKPLLKDIIETGVFETAIVLKKNKSGRDILIFTGEQIKEQIKSN